MTDRRRPEPVVDSRPSPPAEHLRRREERRTGARIDWPVERDPVFGCLLWTAALSSNGYPIIWSADGPKTAKREVYEKELGPIGAELVLDHLCRRIICVAWFHMEPVTKRENELRKSWMYRCRRTRCARGHDLSTAIVTPEMGRLCRVCNSIALEDLR